jgi:hypothetical protein
MATATNTAALQRFESLGSSFLLGGPRILNLMGFLSPNVRDQGLTKARGATASTGLLLIACQNLRPGTTRGP